MRHGVVIGVDLVVAVEGSEAAEVLEAEGLEVGDDGEGTCCSKALALACLFSEAFCRENTILHMDLAVSNVLKRYKQCKHVCNRISPFSRGALGI